MINGTLADVAQHTHGQLRGAAVRYRGISTDTRTLAADELFVALKGEHFDAHDYLDATSAAAGVLLSRECVTAGPQVMVADTRLALGDLARAWRRAHRLPVIAVTGSNGKTTTKEMIASILRQQGATLATQGNLNNDIGVPLTLFQLAPEHRYAVLEMGANRPDDIRDLVTIAEPTLALVTMCGPAHLAGFGDLDGVARAKGQVYAQLGAAGTAVLNRDDAYYEQWRAVAGAARVITFGLDHAAQVSACDLTPAALGTGTYFTLRAEGSAVPVHLPLDGPHNVRNALAAAAVGLGLEVPLAIIVQGLESVSAVKGRLTVRHGNAGLTIIDDTYNANPASLAAALALLADQPAPRWMVLGDMGELGADSAAAHRLAGESARAAGVERLLSVGPLAALAATAFGRGAQAFATREAALEVLRCLDTAGVTLLAKGSRSMQIDLVVAGLLAAPKVSLC